MIRRALAKRYAGTGGAAPGGDGIEIWDDVRSAVGRAGRGCRSVADWRLPALPARPGWPAWPSWPGWRGKRGGEAADPPGPAGTAANIGEHRIREDDLGDRLARLRGGRPERASLVLAGVAANLFRAKGEQPEIDVGDDPEGGPDGWPDRVCILAGGEDSRTAVLCISRPPDARVGADTVVRFRRECGEAGIKRAIVITDSAFSTRCRREADGGSIKMELWDWPRLGRELRTHLLGVPERRDAGFPAGA